MYCRVLACDFDGTGAAEGRLAPEVEEALSTVRADGSRTLLVTGRVLEDLRRAGVDFGAFDAIVAENGAIVWLPSGDRTIRLGVAPPESFLGRLRSAGVAFHVGDVIVGTWEEHTAQVIDLIREQGVDLQLVFNRAAVMLLPSGVNKAVGVQRALVELGRSPRNMVAFGDAENDLPLFGLAQLAVAARGSVEVIARSADDHVSLPGAAGVAQYLSRIRERGYVLATPTRHAFEIGRTSDGRAVGLPLGGNVLVSGDPRSGKSWLAGLVSERLVENGYSVCVIDPEGDYTTLEERPGLLAFGQKLALPVPHAVPQLLRHTGCSVVLTLASLAQGGRCQYASAALAALQAERRASGVPHWIVVDEAQYFFRVGEPSCAVASENTGNVVFVTYRPSLLPDVVHESIAAHLVTRTVVDDERYFVDSLLRRSGPADLVPPDALADLEPGTAGLLVQTSDGRRWERFLPGPRVSRHAHHLCKYADALLPAHKGFVFRSAADRVVSVARNVREFCDAVRTVPLDSLQHHLVARDFSRWSRDVLGDEPLAAGLTKLEIAAAGGARASRDEILAHVEGRYVIPPHLDRQAAGG
jgi:hypothetical protein